MPHLNYPILNCYDNTCYRICFLLLVGEDFFRLESPCSCERVCVSVVREYVFPVVPRSSNYSRTGVSSRDSGWFWLFLPICKFNHLVLIMTASLFSAVPKRLSNLLKLLTCFVLFLRSSSKFLCCLTSPMTMSRPPWTGSCRWVLSSSDQTSP